uniref:Uncharacterized protein n=1 Tax=Glossina pallidipes TaxID=7398 RepID=A0A1B0AAQ2_GLOPL
MDCIRKQYSAAVAVVDLLSTMDNNTNNSGRVPTDIRRQRRLQRSAKLIRNENVLIVGLWPHNGTVSTNGQYTSGVRMIRRHEDRRNNDAKHLPLSGSLRTLWPFIVFNILIWSIVRVTHVIGYESKQAYAKFRPQANDHEVNTPSKAAWCGLSLRKSGTVCLAGIILRLSTTIFHLPVIVSYLSTAVLHLLALVIRSPATASFNDFKLQSTGNFWTMGNTALIAMNTCKWQITTRGVISKCLKH